MAVGSWISLDARLRDHARALEHRLLRCRQLQATSHALADCSPFAIVVTDARARVLATNGAGAQFLRAGWPLAASHDRIVAADAVDGSMLHAALKAVTTGVEAAQTLRFCRDGDPAVTVSVRRHAEPSSNIPVALLLTHRSARRGPDAASLSQWFGLSRAEAAVAAWLVEGLTIAETADRLCVSVLTARTHVKRILAKSGTRRQADFVRAALLRASDTATATVPSC